MRPRLKRLIMSMPVGSAFRQDVDVPNDGTSANGVSKNINVSMSENDLELLAQLQAANSALESDKKSVASFTGDERKQSLNESNNNKSSGSQADDVSIKSTNSLKSQISSTQTDEMDEETEIETAQRELVSTWSKLLDEWDSVIKRRTQYVRDLVVKGVPRELRCIAWQYLCGAHNSSTKDKYMDYLKQTSACEKVIRRDITRTYPEHEFFAEKDGLGQESLFNVMKAYSLHDREVGYCQGSCFIVGLLLMVMPEEEAFTVLCQLMSEYRLRLLYKPAMFELGVCMYQLEYLMQEQLPALYQHFQAQCFHTSMYASSWFLTLFTTQLPLNVCFRIMDMFLLDGMEVIFKVGVAILMISESDLLCLDMEGMLTFFQDNFKSLNDEEVDNLFNQISKVKYNSKKMKKLEKEYSLLKMKENEDQVELRRLRSENRLLRQRIDNLEKENVTLADRLIQGQVTLAQEAEVMFGVKRELSQLREQNKELKRSLGASEQQITQLKQSQSVEGGEVDIEKVTTLQEELIAVKLREAESNLALRELANHVTDLDKEWQKYQERTPNDKLSRSQSQSAHDDLMSAKFKETQYLTSISQLKLKLTDSETSAQTANNKVERLLEENERLRGQVSKQRDDMTTLQTEVDEHKNNIANFQSKSAEDVMASKINSVEHSALIAELRTRIAELEVKNQELSATAAISPVIITPPHKVTDNGGVIRRQKSESSPLPNNDILNITRNSLSFSTLDIIKGDFNDSDNSDGDNCESGPSRHNSETSNTGPSRRLTVMEMDKDDETFEKRTRSHSLNPNELNGSLVLS